MVGIAQLVSAPDCGSGGPGFESLYPPSVTDGYILKIIFVVCVFHTAGFLSENRCVFNGLSQSGKAQDFDSCIRWFKSS